MLAASFRDISGDVAESYLSSHKPFETESSQSFDLKFLSQSRVLFRRVKWESSKKTVESFRFASSSQCQVKKIKNIPYVFFLAFISILSTLSQFHKSNSSEANILPCPSLAPRKDPK